ncbi:MAG: hypothetical protein GDA43_16970 [Hormoscilla sp. SP5CHS1]|nr:hypothetical protein [Hormoscilla sp. SP12CHS1]MBC6454682.1 hypothetical protein [Hormoscilla sp. SP5CHS1]
MGKINISNSRDQDAAVNTESVSPVLKMRWLDIHGSQVETKKILRGTMDRDLDALLKKYGDLENITQALINEDPEIDIETYGSFLKNTARVYIDPKREIVHRIVQNKIIKNPDGSEREKRPRHMPEPNTATEIPLKWTGKKMKKSQVFNKFVFSGKLQITHINGLTYDFLYAIAKELEDRDCLMLLGGGPKGNQPLIFRRGATPYRGFLEGRTQNDKYALILHLSKMELKKPGD